MGHSVGELGCAYADGTFTAEQTVLAAYWRGLCILESKLPLGAMAAIGKSAVVSSKHNHPLMFTPLCVTGKTCIFLCHTPDVPLLSIFLFFHLELGLPGAHGLDIFILDACKGILLMCILNLCPSFCTLIFHSNV
jgi:hypothetical protein